MTWPVFPCPVALTTGNWRMVPDLPPVCEAAALSGGSTLSRQDSVSLSQLAECLAASVAVSVSPA